jgi:hypothetical protein
MGPGAIVIWRIFIESIQPCDRLKWQWRSHYVDINFIFDSGDVKALLRRIGIMQMDKQPGVSLNTGTPVVIRKRQGQSKLRRLYESRPANLQRIKSKLRVFVCNEVSVFDPASFGYSFLDFLGGARIDIKLTFGDADWPIIYEAN